MKFLVALLLCLSALCFADEEPAATSDVVTLTTDNFAGNTNSGYWLVEFFAPWCGHCKRLAPIWEELATKSKGNFNVAKVDCTVEKDLCSQTGIRGYPTLKFYADGKVSDYSGARTIEAFESFVNNIKTGANAGEPKVQERAPVEEKKEVPQGEATSDVVILEDATFEEKTKEGDWLIKFYAPWCGHCKRLAPIWDELATQAKGKFNVAKVDCTIHSAACTKEGVRGYPTVKLFSHGQKFDYKGPRTIEDFTKFVESSRVARDEL